MLRQPYHTTNAANVACRGTRCVPILAMRILLWHGYLLRGSGSNVYAANLAAIWRSQGHDLLLLCQERDAAALASVDEQGDFSTTNDDFSTAPTGASPAAGRCRLVRPHIGKVLPVYVYDRYEGFQAKPFVDLTAAELERYVSSNVAALTAAIEDHGPEAIVVGHEVMGPHIARLACEATATSYVAKLHGSALEYAVKRQERYREFAGSGLRGARSVVGPSRYMIEEAAKVVPGWEHKAVVINPGVDVDLFRPIERVASRRPTIGFVGKLMGPKGVQDLLLALPLLARHNPQAVIVGFGELAETYERMWTRLRARDLGAVRSLIEENQPTFAAVGRFLASGIDLEQYLRGAEKVDVSFTGRAEHDALAPLLPTFDVLVVPSVWPEAFGMVAAEAAACGVLPVVPAHSGVGEAGAMLEAHLSLEGCLTYDPSDPVRGIASRVEGILALPPTERRSAERGAAAFARSTWSWEHVADALLGAAT